MLEWIGYEVDREYYFNNAGRQMRVLGDWVRLRYLELLNEKVEFPEDYYQGEYIKEIAVSLFDEYKDSLKAEPAEGKFKERAEVEIFKDIERTLNRLGIHHKIFYNENSLYEEGKIKNLLNEFKEKDLSYEKDNATWLSFPRWEMSRIKLLLNHPVNRLTGFRILHMINQIQSRI